MRHIFQKHYSLNLKSPISFFGLPGASDTGILTSEMLIEATDAKLFAGYYSYIFSDHVLVEDDGTCRLLRYEFYETSTTSPNIVVIKGG